MLFNSLTFFLFLPAVCAIFAAVNPTYRWLVILLASYAFYAATGTTNTIALAAVTLVAYFSGLAIVQGRNGWQQSLAMTAGLSLVIGSLAAFKFYDFLAGETERYLFTVAGFHLPRIGMPAPAGYSFYAFMAASYIIDVRFKLLPAERQLGKLAFYVSFFPKILAGPIERAPGFLSQVTSSLQPKPEMMIAGLQLIGWGLFKKVVIADNLAPLVDKTFKVAAFASPIDLITSIYFFAFQIYCDFSGYSDMAIGIALLFGLRLTENFRRPYFAVSTAEFWSRRWHISLGKWFRDYLFVPLGGSKKGALRQYANIMLVFVVSGLWHAGMGYGVGWTFLVWGALNGFYQWAGLATRPMWAAVGAALPGIAASGVWRAARILLTFHLILASWVFFRAASVDQAVTVLRRIAASLASIPFIVAKYPYTADHYLGFGLIAFLVGVEVLDERRPLAARLAGLPTAIRWSTYYAVIFTILLEGQWQASKFIYMQF